MFKKKDMSYSDSVHYYGSIWGNIILVLVMLFPISLCIIFGVVPKWDSFFSALFSTIIIYWPVGVIEYFTYVPMLGSGGSYLSFITGNISNLKLPCAISAIEASGFSVSSEEGDIISTISIAVSSIVTMTIIILGVLLIVPLTPVLQSEALAPAFENVIPALFGALGVVFISKDWKIALLPIFVMLVLFIFVPALNEGTVGIMVPVGVIITVIEARIMYKKGWLDDKKEVKKNKE
ncbi:MAG: hypothetical protein MJ066_02350 [Clostridia bacterium]|nr:hypothetical protein [Clostridia bacterium]